MISYQARAEFRRKRRHLQWLLAASVATPLLLFAGYARESWHNARADADERLRQRSAVLAEHVGRVFDSMRLALDLIDARLGGLDDEAIRTHPDIETLLNAPLALAGVEAGVHVIDSAGILLHTTLPPPKHGTDLSYREYFTGPAAGGGVHVTPQLSGRVTGRRLFTLSKRRTDGGVLAGLVYAEYFEKLFAASAEKDTGAVGLFLADGRQLVRYPPIETPVTLPPKSGLLLGIARADSGTFKVVSMVDARERWFGYARVGGFPVYVSYGVDAATVQAGWLRSILAGALAAAGAATGLAAFVLLAMRRARESAIVASRLEHAVAERTAEAERANAAKSQFLAAASHDLRQPVQAVRLFLDVLGERLDDEQNLKTLEYANQALGAAEDLLSALLDVSTLEAGMVAPHARDFALSGLLAELCDEFAPQAESAGLSFRCVPGSARVVSDPVLLARMLRNLLTNALRYTRSGGVLLGSRRRGAVVRIEVWDTGIGIPPERVPEVFDDFVQLGNPERDRTKGLGLGLAVVRRMAALLELPLGVRSVPGRGTVFWIEVPLAREG